MFPKDFCPPLKMPLKSKCSHRNKAASHKPSGQFDNVTRNTISKKIQPLPLPPRSYLLETMLATSPDQPKRFFLLHSGPVFLWQHLARPWPPCVPSRKVPVSPRDLPPERPVISSHARSPPGPYVQFPAHWKTTTKREKRNLSTTVMDGKRSLGWKLNIHVFHSHRYKYHNY